MMKALQGIFLFLLWINPGYIAGENPESTHGVFPVYFPSQMLHNPRENAGELLSLFAYNETDLFEPAPDAGIIKLANGYASARIRNNEDYTLNHDSARVTRIKIVFTKYPYHKQDWRTNYFDLLAWRLKALFELDPLLNDPAIEWELVLQTRGETDAQARQLFHGIVLYYEPQFYAEADNITPAESPSHKKFTPIENQGFLIPQGRNHDFFRSRLQFEPDSGSVPRRNMRPPDIKCPRWR